MKIQQEVVALTKKDVARFQAILEDKATELQPDLKATRRDLKIARTADDLDNTVQYSQRDLSTVTGDRKSQSLKNVLAALRRIESGNYGECEHCEEPISVKRLEAVPEASTCATCQSNLEVASNRKYWESTPAYA